MFKKNVTYFIQAEKVVSDNLEDDPWSGKMVDIIDQWKWQQKKADKNPSVID